MRNLQQHPITTEEITTFLNRASTAAMADGLIGDIRPKALSMACDIVEAAAALVAEVNRRTDHEERDVFRYGTPWKEVTALIVAFQTIKKFPTAEAKS